MLPYLNENSVLIFDDIHWSDEMEKAWEAVKSNPQVTLSLDLFFKGIVFFRKDFKQKSHLVLQF
ncbi:MAG: SAM-dependent methyltransferase, partial [Chitinophagales bacterium]